MIIKNRMNFIVLGTCFICYAGSTLALSYNNSRSAHRYHRDTDKILSESQEATSFIKGSKMYLGLRNEFIRRSYDPDYSAGLILPTGWRQWAQGVRLEFQSGYEQDVFGLDASFYGAFKLSGNNPQNVPDELLRVTTKNGAPEYSQYYGRIGVLNAKVKIGSEMNQAVIRAGFLPVDTALLAVSTSRVLPSSYRGIGFSYTSSQWKGLSLYGYAVDRYMPRAGNEWTKFRTSTGDNEIENLQIYGLQYTFDQAFSAKDSLFVHAEYGQAKKYTKQIFSEMIYSYNFSDNNKIMAAVRYIFGRRGGSLWNIDTDGYDQQASYLNAQIKAVFNHLTLGVSSSAVKADNSASTAVGASSYLFRVSLAPNDYGKGPYSTARHYAGFNYDKEKVYQGSIEYDFKGFGISGLNAALTYTRGHNMNVLTGLKSEQETDLRIQYAFQQPALEGLLINLEHAWYSRDKIPTSIVAESRKIKDLRFYIDYTLPLFK